MNEWAPRFRYHLKYINQMRDLKATIPSEIEQAISTAIDLQNRHAALKTEPPRLADADDADAYVDHVKAHVVDREVAKLLHREVIEAQARAVASILRLGGSDLIDALKPVFSQITAQLVKTVQSNPIVAEQTAETLVHQPDAVRRLWVSVDKLVARQNHVRSLANRLCKAMWDLHERHPHVVLWDPATLTAEQIRQMCGNPWMNVPGRSMGTPALIAAGAVPRLLNLHEAREAIQAYEKDQTEKMREMQARAGLRPSLMGA